jgi:hypothetical protein
MTQVELFLKLAQPNQNGFSRKICAYEFVGEYQSLRSGNGYKWPEGLLGKFEFDRGGRGNGWFIRLTGFCNKEQTRTIRPYIYNTLSNQICEHTAYGDLSSDRIEVDHRNGRYNNPRALNLDTQIIDDFMALSRRANLKKREDCKKCKLNNERFDARCMGFKVGWTQGNEKHDGTENGCVGCYWYGPIEFRNNL